MNKQTYKFNTRNIYKLNINFVHKKHPPVAKSFQKINIYIDLDTFVSIFNFITIRNNQSLCEFKNKTKFKINK